jgi:hypothetical protein
MKSIYNSLLSRINSGAQLFTTNGLKPIAHIDRFKGQYLNPELHQPWHVPAIFFKFNINWADKGQNTQRGAGILEVHIELENYHESYSGSPDKDAALKDYDYVAIIHSLIQGFGGSTWSAFSRITTDEDENPSNTNVTIVRYVFDVDDDSTEKYANWVKQKLDDMVTQRKPARVVPLPADDDEYHV